MASVARRIRGVGRWIERVRGSHWWPVAVRVTVAATGIAGLTILGMASMTGNERNAIAATSTPSSEPSPPQGTAPMDGGAPPLLSPPSTGPPSPRAATAPRGRASPEDPVVLNEATEGDLRRLPGVGPTRARAILELRGRLGRFRTVDDLLRVKGMGRGTVRRLRPLVRVDGAGQGGDGGVLPQR